MKIINCTAARLRDGRSGIRVPVWGKTFYSSPKGPDRLWGPPSHLFNGYRVSFPRVKRPVRKVAHTHPSNSEVKKWVEVYHHSPLIRLHDVDTYNCLFMNRKIWISDMASSVTRLHQKLRDFYGVPVRYNRSCYLHMEQSGGQWMTAFGGATAEVKHAVKML